MKKYITVSIVSAVLGSVVLATAFLGYTFYKKIILVDQVVQAVILHDKNIKTIEQVLVTKFPDLVQK
jgi:hypothetical protein